MFQTTNQNRMSLVSNPIEFQNPIDVSIHLSSIYSILPNLVDCRSIHPMDLVYISFSWSGWSIVSTLYVLSIISVSSISSIFLSIKSNNVSLFLCVCVRDLSLFHNAFTRTWAIDPPVCLGPRKLNIWLWDWDSCVKSAKGLKSNTRSRYTCKVVPCLVRDCNGYHSHICMRQWIIPVITNANVGGSSINIDRK